MIAPNKARVYPEHLGRYARYTMARESNYAAFRSEFSRAGIPMLDLNALVIAWGPCGPVCPADINQDGTVDVLDLVALITLWGFTCG